MTDGFPEFSIGDVVGQVGNLNRYLVAHSHWNFGPTVSSIIYRLYILNGTGNELEVDREFLERNFVLLDRIKRID